MALVSNLMNRAMSRGIDQIVRNPAQYENALKAMLQGAVPTKQKGFFETLFKSLFVDFLAKSGKWQAVEQFSNRWFGNDTRMPSPMQGMSPTYANYGAGAVGGGYPVGGAYGVGGTYGTPGGGAYGVGGGYNYGTGGLYNGIEGAKSGIIGQASRLEGQQAQLMNRLSANPPPSQAELLKIQEDLNKIKSAMEMISKLLAAHGDINRSIIQNMR